MLVESPAWGTARHVAVMGTRVTVPACCFGQQIGPRCNPPPRSANHLRRWGTNHVEGVALDEGAHGALRQVESPWVQQ